MKVITKHVIREGYKDRYLPINEEARIFCDLVGQNELKAPQLAKIKRLGFELEYQS